MPWYPIFPFLLLSISLSFSFELGQNPTYSFIKDVLEFQVNNQCDLSYVTDDTNPKMITNLVEQFSQDKRHSIFSDTFDTVCLQTNSRGETTNYKENQQHISNVRCQQILKMYMGTLSYNIQVSLLIYRVAECYKEQIWML